jgi:bifunctional UDP-N-acetylglucosamine pyrophosphorylase/glucosamine-1-phosphate N-acetyltransferase
MSEHSTSLAVVVLAAGIGKRMRSETPKALHRVCGSTLLECVLDQVEGLGAREVVVVVGHGAAEVSSVVGERARCVVQAEQNGTGHAVAVAAEVLGPDIDELLVVSGDSPLVRSSTLESLAEARRAESAAASMLTAVLEDPTGYGRVLRGEGGGIERIVEEADAVAGERDVREVNACAYAFDRAPLETALKGLTNENAQGEYYLTDVIEGYVDGGLRVIAVVGSAEEAMGVNDRSQLAFVGELMRDRINRELMLSGVTMVDPRSTYVDLHVAVGRDTVLLPMTFLRGSTRIGEGCSIGPCTEVNDSVLGDGCIVTFSWLDGCEVSSDVEVGPYSRLRPGSRVGSGCRVGSYVETKNSVIGRGSKVPHLSYIGDAEIGEDVNVGAGSITCNYDGEKKHRTVIGDRAFIGSDTMMVAPVKIGADAATGAGSAIYEDVPDGSLGVERSEQKNIPGWRKKRKDGRARRR